jgi:hypothetical protein
MGAGRAQGLNGPTFPGECGSGFGRHARGSPGDVVNTRESVARRGWRCPRNDRRIARRGRGVPRNARCVARNGWDGPRNATARPRPTARLRLCRSVVETRGRGVVDTRESIARNGQRFCTRADRRSRSTERCPTSSRERARPSWCVGRTLAPHRSDCVGHLDEEVGARGEEQGKRSELEAHPCICLGVLEVFGQHS